jgi:hypothetical protein
VTPAPALDAGARPLPDAGLSPPPVTATDGFPKPDPACPDDAPAADTPCMVAAGTALSCAWQDGAAIERCACVAKEDLPPDAQLLWNCDDGPSGEGPPTDTCPDAAPQQGSACNGIGSSCHYASPPNTKCECRDQPPRWVCGPAAFGGP